jgi:thymidylate synthase
MAHIDRAYGKMVQAILRDGFAYADKSRSNIGMLEIPHYLLDIDITQGFPLLTTKKIYWKAFTHELIWMLSGSTNIDYLQANKVNIWDQDAKNFSGGTYVGRIYGAQWRRWRGYDLNGKWGFDQIATLIEGMKQNIYTRRHIVTAWNPAELSQMALPPCHYSFQVFPTKEGFGLKWHQRSCDTLLGIPFDIGLYALLGKLLERETNIEFTRLIGDLTCVHLYEPHIELIKEQLDTKPYDNYVDITIAEEANFNDLNINNFKVHDYLHHPPIKAKMYAKD